MLHVVPRCGLALLSVMLLSFAAGPVLAGPFEDLFAPRPQYYQPQPAPFFGQPQYSQPQVDAQASIIAQRKAALWRKAQRARAEKRRLAAKAKMLAMQQIKNDAALAYAPSAPTVRVPTSAQQAIASVMSDETLRPGDAFMGPNGLQIVTAPPKKAKASFVAIAKFRAMPSQLRAVLAAVDMPRLLPKRNASRAVALAVSSPQPMQASAQPAAQKWVSGPNGKLIRFVGGGYYGEENRAEP